MISTFTAFFDANVFYGAWLRSLIITVAQTKLFRARWSEQVHDEWTRNLVQNRPDLTMANLERTRRLMDDAAPDCLVRDYEPLIAQMRLPDPDDAHVLAAAIRCQASCIVTFNLVDFPGDVLAPFSLHAVHPDDFLLDAASIDSAAFGAAVGDDVRRYIRPKLTLDSYIESLRAAGVPKTAAEIARLGPSIDITA